jgi:hypothetical protein
MVHNYIVLGNPVAHYAHHVLLVSMVSVVLAYVVPRVLAELSSAHLPRRSGLRLVTISLNTRCAIRNGTAGVHV